MLLQELAEQTQVLGIQGDPRVEIRGISYDSRLVREGDLFVAIKGEKTSGALFLHQALRRGASAVASDQPLDPQPEVPVLMVENARVFLAAAARVFHGDPASRMQLAAITGTNGKTTTTFLLDEIFRQAGIRSCLVGTTGMKIARQPFPAKHTTPEAADLTAFLSRALESGCTHGAVEVSSHALALRRVLGIRFRIGVFTNLTEDHLDFHHDMESYYRAKRILFLPEGGNRIEKAVINTDDPYGRRLANEVTCPVLRFGFDRSGDIHVIESETTIEGTTLSLATPRGTFAVRSRLVGRPNIYNIMSAAAAALEFGLTVESIRTGIEALTGVPGRMEHVEAGQDFVVIVDYAHTPDALEKLLETVKAMARGRLITVFGCGGDRDRQKRPLMGEIAARLSDRVIATSDNPRSEDPLAILNEIEPGLRTAPAAYELVPDRRTAIRSALSAARRNDVVVIAGKGHEDYQILGDRVVSFDDRIVARDLILQLTESKGARN